jgi:hypothetical protein
MVEYKYVVTISRALSTNSPMPSCYGFCAGIFPDFIQAADMVAYKINLLATTLKEKCRDAAELAAFDRAFRVFEDSKFAWTRKVEYATANGEYSAWFFHIEEVEV